MQRREFVRSAIVGSGVSLGAGMTGAQAQGEPGAGGQQFYQLRRYTLRSGPEMALLESYLAGALIPAANRLGMKPVGAFKLDVGPETPTVYVLLPGDAAGALAVLDATLERDAGYVQAAAGFRDAPAAAPAFAREERWLLSAFAGWPRLTPPRPGKRLFQLRTYESPSHAAHLRKVAMFNEAEIAIFNKNGLHPVFFGQTLVGSRMPSLTYMVAFADLAELTAHWAAFGADPAWKELSHRPGNADGEIVSNISNLYLSPLACSQV